MTCSYNQHILTHIEWKDCEQSICNDNFNKETFLLILLGAFLSVLSDEI